MLKKERQTLILKEINIHNKVILSDLSQKFNVSEDTIRRDLQELADADKIIKVRGGALSKSYHIYSYREHDIYAHQEKTIIAQKAISLLRDGMLVLISGGSTNLEIARVLPPDLNVTFLTISLSTAMQLVDHPASEVIFLGGPISKSSRISIGADVVAQLHNVHPDICFVGTNSIDAKEGIMENDWEVATIKRAMIRASNKVAVLAISEKLDSRQQIRVCGLQEVDYLITELNPDNGQLQPYKTAGLKVL